jgi:hypothetical protein
MREPPTRWGLTLPFAGVPLAATAPLVRRAEAAGWDDLWTGDTSGPDGFTPLALAAAWTERMRLGTGVVNAFTRGPAVLAQHAAALAGEIADGTFVNFLPICAPEQLPGLIDQLAPSRGGAGEA